MKKIYILIVIGLIIIGVWMVFSDRIIEENLPEKETEIFQENQEDIVKQEVILVIDYGDGNFQTFNIEFVEEMTAFDLLNDRAEELSLETKAYDIGIFIETIGDKKNGQDGKYWMYYVNEEMPMVSADNLEISPGDKVEFKFEESQF